MPRLTKRQKEAGAQKKKRPVSGGGGGKPKGGFKVGPTNAPRNAYLGKAQRKKAELIEAAKVKQQYAKVLAKEGMQSVRVGGSVSARDRPTKRAERVQQATDNTDGEDSSDDEDAARVKRPATRKRSASASSLGSDAGSDSGDSSDDDDEAARFAARMRQKAREADEARARGDKPGDKLHKATKGKRRGEDGGVGGVRHGRAGPAPNERPKKRPRPAAENDTRPRARALSPPKIAPTEGRMRDLQREAFAKRHHARADGSGRGQPRMGARMDVLLEKIRRSK